MAEKPLQDIPRPLRDQYERGVAAFHKDNLDYALTLLGEVLRKEPGFYAAREALRAAQFKRRGAASGGLFKRLLGHGQAAPQLARAQILLRTNPAEALHAAEQILNDDPQNGPAHRLLADAATQLGLVRTAVLSREILFKQHPADRDAALALARALIPAGLAPRADKILADLLAANPADLEVAKVYKDLGARRTLKEQGYEQFGTEGASYRDALRDEAEAAALEQAQRVQRSDAAADRVAAGLAARLQQAPDDLKALRDLADLHVQRGELQEAIAVLGRAAAGDAAVDPSLERHLLDLRLRRLDQQLAAAGADAAEHARLTGERAAAEIAGLQKLADRHPTDLGLRHDLGAAFLRAGRPAEAIRELQKAQHQPSRRIAALGLLGEAFAARGMLDLAARTLQNALKEKPVFDEEKKALHYQLGCVLERMQQPGAAVEQFKLIYENDVGYRDVADKVDAHYAAKAA
jgi:cytochrome c-type biogenesis protein CcmH/NrfG